MKFTKKGAVKFGWKGIEGLAYNSKEDFAGASAAYFEVAGSHGKTKTAKSDRIYLVLEGKGKFIIDGKITSVQKTDVIIVPKNTPYDYRNEGGVMKLFLVHCPAFDQSAETEL